MLTKSETIQSQNSNPAACLSPCEFWELDRRVNGLEVARMENKFRMTTFLTGSLKAAEMNLSHDACR